MTIGVFTFLNERICHTFKSIQSFLRLYLPFTPSFLRTLIGSKWCFKYYLWRFLFQKTRVFTKFSWECDSFFYRCNLDSFKTSAICPPFFCFFMSFSFFKKKGADWRRFKWIIFAILATLKKTVMFSSQLKISIR